MEFMVWYELSKVWAWTLFLAGLSVGLFFSIVFFTFLIDSRRKEIFNIVNNAGVDIDEHGERGIPIE